MLNRRHSYTNNSSIKINQVMVTFFYLYLMFTFFICRSLVKSVGIFAVGVVIASECAGLEIMPAMPQ